MRTFDESEVHGRSCQKRGNGGTAADQPSQAGTTGREMKVPTVIPVALVRRFRMGDLDLPIFTVMMVLRCLHRAGRV